MINIYICEMSLSKSWTVQEERDWQEVIPNVLHYTLPFNNWQLDGAMGVGKTTFVRALAHYLGFEEVSSPTFSIVNEYPIRKKDFPYNRIYHVDLYRLDPEELQEVGFEEYLYAPDSLTIVEWPDIATHYWVAPYVRLELKEKESHKRELMVILNP